MATKVSLRPLVWFSIYDRESPYGRVLPGVPPAGILYTEPDPLERETTSDWRIAGRDMFISGQGIN